MITRKHLFFAIAATCLLTTFLFGVVPIKSGSYDPSLDANHDGKIDGKDIALPALIFGTAGDPTVPVNVTNWQTYITGVETYNISWVSGQNEKAIGGVPNFAGGFNRIYMDLEMKNASTAFYGANLFIYLFNLQFMDPTGYFNQQTFGPAASLNMTVVSHDDFGGWVTFKLDMAEPLVMKGPYFVASLDVTGLQSIAASGWVTVNINYYLRNE